MSLRLTREVWEKIVDNIGNGIRVRNLLWRKGA